MHHGAFIVIIIFTSFVLNIFAFTYNLTRGYFLGLSIVMSLIHILFALAFIKNSNAYPKRSKGLLLMQLFMFSILVIYEPIIAIFILIFAFIIDMPRAISYLFYHMLTLFYCIALGASLNATVNELNTTLFNIVKWQIINEPIISVIAFSLAVKLLILTIITIIGTRGNDEIETIEDYSKNYRGLLILFILIGFLTIFKDVLSITGFIVLLVIFLICELAFTSYRVSFSRSEEGYVLDKYMSKMNKIKFILKCIILSPAITVKLIFKKSSNDATQSN